MHSQCVDDADVNMAIARVVIPWALFDATGNTSPYNP